jgi:hypothetical protein
MKRTIFASAVVIALVMVGVLFAAENKNWEERNVLGEKNDRHSRSLPLPKKLGGAVEQEAMGAPAESQGIQGNVINNLGNPVGGIIVVANNTSKGPLVYSRTDSQGHFSFKGLPVGTYEVYAQYKDGPLIPNSNFYAGDSARLQEVSVHEREVTSTLVVHTPLKMGKIIGRVSKAGSGESLVAAVITLRRVNNPGAYLITEPDEKGNFSIPVPTVPITVEISAEGYEGKIFDVLKLKRGEKKLLDGSLRPVK